MNGRTGLWIFGIVSVAIFGAGVVMMVVRDAEGADAAGDGAYGDDGVLESVPDGVDVRFLIGIGSTGTGRQLDLQRVVPGGTALEPFEFDEARADRQRRAAVADGDCRDGTPFQLKDAAGLLPVWWMPRTPFGAAREDEITITEAQLALMRARAGKPYEASHIRGGWLYAPPEFYGPGLPGFGGQDMCNICPAVTMMGTRAVNYEIRRGRQDDFHDFTDAFVGHAKALVVGGEIVIAPELSEALSARVQISGGGNGFSDEEVDYLLRALGHPDYQ